MIPKQMFLTKGVGTHADKLVSFEMALRQAGISGCNLVLVSSILPPDCEIIGPEEGKKKLKDGQITFCVMARTQTNQAGEPIAASIGLAYPEDRIKHGYLSEHAGVGLGEEKAARDSERMAVAMLASLIDDSFDHDLPPQKKDGVYVLSKTRLLARHMTASAKGDESGRWTTAVAAAVFVM